MAADKSEALWKYHCNEARRRGLRPSWVNLSEYRKTDYAAGGWGFFVAQLAPDEHIDEDGYFKKWYEERRLNK